MKTINLYDNLQIMLKIINIGFGRWLSVVFFNLGVATPSGLNNPFIGVNYRYSTYQIFSS